MNCGLVIRSFTPRRLRLGVALGTLEISTPLLAGIMLLWMGMMLLLLRMGMMMDIGVTADVSRARRE